MYSDNEDSDDNIPLAVVRGILKKNSRIAGSLNKGDISNIFKDIDSGSDSEFPSSSDDESATPKPKANGRAMHAICLFPVPVHRDSREVFTPRFFQNGAVEKVLNICQYLLLHFVAKG